MADIICTPFSVRHPYTHSSCFIPMARRWRGVSGYRSLWCESDSLVSQQGEEGHLLHGTLTSYFQTRLAEDLGVFSFIMCSEKLIVFAQRWIYLPFAKKGTMGYVAWQLQHGQRIWLFPLLADALGNGSFKAFRYFF